MHKEPKDRAHLWERAHKAAEAPAEDFGAYPLELPRYLHKHGEPALLVKTPDECDVALAAGYAVHLHVVKK
jgi:hypothetical protein